MGSLCRAPWPVTIGAMPAPMKTTASGPRPAGGLGWDSRGVGSVMRTSCEPSAAKSMVNLKRPPGSAPFEPPDPVRIHRRLAELLHQPVVDDRPHRRSDDR